MIKPTSKAKQVFMKAGSQYKVNPNFNFQRHGIQIDDIGLLLKIISLDDSQPLRRITRDSLYQSFPNEKQIRIDRSLRRLARNGFLQ